MLLEGEFCRQNKCLEVLTGPGRAPSHHLEMRIYLSTACVLQCLGDYTYLQGKVAEFWLQRSFHEKDALRLASASGTARLPFEVLVAWWQSLPVMS